MKKRKVSTLLCLLVVILSSLFLARCGTGIGGTTHAGSANAMKF